MIKEIHEIFKIIEFLDDCGKDEWVSLLHGFITYISENISESDDSDIDYSEEEGNAVDEGIPEVYVDSRGFHSLV
jgi:hypothetical protein